MIVETSAVVYVWPWWPRPGWSCMCMALVAETSVVMYVYGLGGRDLCGHVCVWPL